MLRLMSFSLSGGWCCYIFCLLMVIRISMKRFHLDKMVSLINCELFFQTFQQKLLLSKCIENNFNIIPLEELIGKFVDVFGCVICFNKIKFTFRCFFLFFQNASPIVWAYLFFKRTLQPYSENLLFTTEIYLFPLLFAGL